MSFLVGLYNTVQKLPDPVLRAAAAVMPFSADSYAPRGFFTPRPALPPAAKPPKGLHVLDGLDGSNLILQPYCEIKGTVIYVELSPPVQNGVPAWDHETFAIVPDNPSYMNAYNNQVVPGATSSAIALPANHMFMECEPVLGSQLPVAGQRVRVFGGISIQLAWGYIEFRPCYSWQLI